MPRSAAQAEAARTNGKKSRGPSTEEGKARSARNARTFGFRSACAGLYDGDDEARFRQLEASIHERFQPACLVEASICARMTMALWRAERADRLEAEYWCLVPAGVSKDTPLRMARTLRDEEANRRHGLQTVLRYQSEAMNGFNRALRALTQLRQGRAEPQAAPPPANQNLPAEPAPAVPTNEPEPVAGSAVAAPPPDADAADAADADRAARLFQAWHDHCQRRIDAFVDGVPYEDAITDNSTKEPRDRPDVAGRPLAQAYPATP